MDLCYCKENYIIDSKRNIATRRGENNVPNHDSEPANYLNKNKNITTGQFWQMLLSIQEQERT